MFVTMVTKLMPQSELHDSLQEGRQRTLQLIEDLTDEQMIGPRLAIVNPLRWELGHVGYFQEFWVLRHFRKQPPARADGDALYDSARIAHDTRWDLPLPSKGETIAYIQRILERVVGVHRPAVSEVSRKIDGYDEAYFLRLALFHEYMHAEAMTYTRQTLGYSLPKASGIKQNSETDRSDGRGARMTEEDRSRHSQAALG